MKTRNLKTIMQEAATGSDSTSTSTSIIRPSKAGAPLLVHVVEDAWKTLEGRPEFTDLKRKPAKAPKRNTLAALKSNMSTAIGYLFEAAVRDLIEEDFPDYTIESQPKLSWGSFHGTADYKLVSDDGSHVVIIDCKAFGVATLREVNSNKLTDNWGYRTQLALYRQAVAAQHPEAEVSAWWYVWCVPARNLFCVELKQEEARVLANAAERRAQDFVQIQCLLLNNHIDEAVALATRECLLPKDVFYGNYCAATGFHYHPLAPLFYPEDNDGCPIADEALSSVVKGLLVKAQEAKTSPLTNASACTTIET
jgi:PD-(D/E)XK nuclease superfamily